MRSHYLNIFLLSFLVFLFSCCVKEFSTEPIYSCNKINLTKTNVIATSGDSILKLKEGFLYMSNDLGKTWRCLENTIGDISFVHWFKDKTCLICGRTKAYWVDSLFSELHESVVYDYDGTILKDSSPHFYTSLHGHKDYEELAGQEVLIWPDYFGEVDDYISRVWYTNDNGHTIICICKNRETLTEDGQLINCRHFHDCAIREMYDEIYITSGDVGDECELIRGRYTDNRWFFTLIGKGALFKFDSITINEPYLFTLCDYTGYGQTGMLRVPILDAAKILNYEYVFTCSNNLPLIRHYSIGRYSVVLYDGSVKGRMLLSYSSEPYHDIKVSFDNTFSSISFLSNPNNNGMVLMRIGAGYDISDLKLNDRMYNLTEAMRHVGYDDFGIL